MVIADLSIYRISHLAKSGMNPLRSSQDYLREYVGEYPNGRSTGLYRP